jgi:hypothetical protein
VSCDHKTLDDHSLCDGFNPRIWTCSKCGTKARWEDDWRYHGNIECLSCHRQRINAVYCGPCAAGLASPGTGGGSK